MTLFIYSFVFYLYVAVTLHARKTLMIDANIIAFVFSFLTFYASQIVMSSIRIRWVKYPVLILYYIIFILLFTYQYRIGNAFDAAIIVDNFALLFYGQTGGMVAKLLSFKDYLKAFIILSAIVFLHFKYNIFKRPFTQKRYLFVSCLVLLASLFFTKTYFDLVNDCFQSGRSYLEPDNYSKELESQKFSFVDEVDKPVFPSQTPNVIIVFVESMNANFMGRKVEGKSITPFLDELRKNSLYASRFYGASVQTIKGQLAALCGVLPLDQYKVATHYPDTNLRCLPEILKDNGYQTVFMKGHMDLSFDNTKIFAENIGYNITATVDDSNMSPEEIEERFWGWGAEDELQFEQAFEKIKKISASGKKYLLTLTTVSMHQTFFTPKSKSYVFKNPRSKEERYMNSMAYTDKALKSFVELLESDNQLDNTVLVIMGDHSFPMGEHGYTNNEKGYNEESFRTPLIMHWPGKIPPKEITQPVSQVDVSPTLLDLMRAKVSNHFIGSSFLQQADDKFIFMLQPYAGRYLVIIKGDYKYIFHKKTGNEILFNLSDDPLEKNNVISESSLQGLVDEFRKQLSFFKLNNYLIKENAVWRDR